jgi:hypothetical protein
MVSDTKQHILLVRTYSGASLRLFQGCNIDGREIQKESKDEIRYLVEQGLPYETT